MRGYQKRVVFLRNPDSTLFDEAYFVLRDAPTPLPDDRDMVAEATRILEGAGAVTPQGKGRTRARLLSYTAAFLLGALSALGLYLLGAALFA